MSLASVLFLTLGLIAAMMLALWLLSLQIRNASIVDIFWGLGFVVVVWTALVASESTTWRGWLTAILTTAWGLRLAAYLSWRNLGAGEDYRYRAMRERHGPRFPLVSLFTVFALQGLVMWVVAMPIQAAHFSSKPLCWLDAVGVIVWVIGWLFETLGDWQLARFKANPTNCGKVMDRGLWRYTRHPNYFGDFMVWWGFYLIACGGGAWWTIFSPLLMSILLMRVSGVTLLERSLEERRPEYAAYMNRTSPFFPWPPKDASHS